VATEETGLKDRLQRETNSSIPVMKMEARVS